MASNSSPDPKSTGRDGLVALAIASVVVATVAIGALAPGTPHKPAQTQIVLPDGDPSCAEWSDGCRICRRLAEGSVCSTPGIACTAGEQQCLHRAAGP